MKKYIIVPLSLLLLFACSSDDNGPSDPETTDSGSPQIAENVVVVSDDGSDVKSSEDDLEKGIYKIEFTGDAPEIVIGDIIVGDEGEGFLRKVTSLTKNGSSFDMETEQATLEDVFEQADLNFQFDLSDLAETDNKNGAKLKSSEIWIDYMAKGVTKSQQAFGFNFNDVAVGKGSASLKISGGTSFDPRFAFDCNIRGFKIQSANFGTDDASLTLNAGYSLNASAGTTFTNEVKLVRARKRLVFTVGAVPVVVTVDLRLGASLVMDIKGEFVASGSYVKKYTLDSGISFENEQWQGRFNLNEETSIDPLSYNGTVNVSEVLAITPNVQVKFYGVVAPYIEPEMFADYNMNTSTISGDWDSGFGVGLNLTTGIKGIIFRRTIFDFNRTDTFKKELWNAPKFIEIVSGNLQEAEEEKELPEPLVLKVTDNLGNPIKFAQVHIKRVKKNGDPSESGSFDSEKVETDDNGLAQFKWTLGKLSDEEGAERFAEVSIKDSEQEEIDQGTPIRLRAEILSSKKLSIVSGNDQSAPENTDLPEPLVVKVTQGDDDDTPVPNFPVFIELVDAQGDPSSSGSITPVQVNTDQEGLASFSWTLGKRSDEQGNDRFAKVTIKDEDGEEIVQDPEVKFTATIKETNCESFFDLSPFKDASCGEVVELGFKLTGKVIETTDEDCGGAGNCSFEYDGENDALWAFPARYVFDFSEMGTMEKIVLKYEFGGRAFLYDKDGNLLASQDGGEESGTFEFINENDSLDAATTIAFSACEGKLICLDIDIKQ